MRRFRFAGEREAVKWQSSQAALDMLRRRPRALMPRLRRGPAATSRLGEPSPPVERLRPLSGRRLGAAAQSPRRRCRFLGDQTEEQLAEATAALEEAAAGAPTFTLRLKGLGAFPGLEHPRILWVGVSEGALEVQRLQARVAEALERHGTPSEPRAWQAHVTIGRVTDEKRWRREGIAGAPLGADRAAATTPFGTMPVTSIALMRSDLYPPGPATRASASVPLSSERTRLTAPPRIALADIDTPHRARQDVWVRRVV